jgi:hypothetical protein
MGSSAPLPIDESRAVDEALDRPALAAVSQAFESVYSLANRTRRIRRIRFLTEIATRRNFEFISRGDSSPPLHVGRRSRGARFELVALRAQQEAPSPER